MKHLSLLVIIFAVLILFTGCPVPGTVGTISGQAYSEYFSEDPSQIDADWNINAILKIDPAINGNSLIVRKAIKGKIAINIQVCI